MDSKINNDGPRDYELDIDKKTGRVKVKTFGQKGADQLLVDSIHVAKRLNEPLWVTLLRLFVRGKGRKTPNIDK